MLKRIEGLLIERADGELLVMKTATQEAHALNQSAGIVFDLCNGTTSTADMAAEIARQTGLPADETIVGLAVAELLDAGLVTAAPPEAPAAFTRRSVIRTLSLSAAAAAMLPIVETILVPSAHAQGSPTPGVPMSPAPMSVPAPKAPASPSPGAVPTPSPVAPGQPM